MYKKFFSIIFLFSSILAISKENITLQLHWKHQFQYAGFYAAIEKGYYKDIGINLIIKEWNNSINNITDLEEGKIDFSIIGSNELDNIFKGSQIKIVSSYLQKTPIALAVKPNIYFPSDLINKNIMGIDKDIKSAVFYKMWENSNVNMNKLNIIPHNFYMEDFIKNKIDAVQVYATDQIFELSSKKVDFNIIDVNDYGINFYDVILITSNEMAMNKPKLVKNFKEATKKGWIYALNHKNEIVDLISNKYNSQNKSKEALLYEAKRLEAFIQKNHYEIGLIEKEKLRRIALVHLNMGNIDNITNIEKHIFTYPSFNQDMGLTNEEKKYLENKDIINICTLPNNMFENEKTFYKSVDIKLVEEITNKLNIKYKFIKTKEYNQSINFTEEGKCDLLSITRITDERLNKLNFTSPFIAQPLVVASNTEVLYIDDFTKLKNKVIAIEQGHQAIKKIRKLYPNIKIREVKNIKEGLKLVKKGIVFGAIDIPISVSQEVKQLGFLDLKIIGSLKIIDGYTMATTKKEPLLNSIVEKTLNSIPSEYINKLTNDWYSIRYEKGIDYQLVWKISILSLIILLILLYWNKKIYEKNLLLEEMQLQLENKNHELEKISITDNLTKIYNRNKLDDVLKNEKSRCDRYNKKFGLIILDIDHFKKVNDTYGHNIGDIVLIEIANILKQNIRASDTLGRWGGEEFLIICVESDLESTIKVAEKCRKAIETFNFTTIKHKTSSFGISIYNKNNSIKETISKADNNLYKAKESGRNRVVY